MFRSPEVAFGDKFRQRRVQLGLSQTEVAERLSKFGVQTKQGYISDVERGEYIPQAPHRQALARALGIDPDEVESMYVEARLEELGLTDPAFTLMFKDVPTMTHEEKAALLRVYYEDILPARRRRVSRPKEQQ